MKPKVVDLKAKVKQYMDFLGIRDLVEVFAEFIRPKSMREQLEIKKEEIRREQKDKTVKITGREKKKDIAM